MHQRHEIFGTLSSFDISASLSACGISDKQEYTDHEAYLFKECRSLIDQGKTYDEIAALFQQKGFKQNAKHQTTELDPKNKKSPKEKKYCVKSLSISELLTRARQQVGMRISLTDAIKILQVCGLPDQDEYNQAECDRFIEACNLVKLQGDSLEHQITSMLSDAAATSEATFINLVSQVTGKRAENIPGLVNQIFLKNVAQKLADSQDDIQSFYAGLEERILEQIEGKSPLRSIMEVPWETKSLPPSPEKPMQSPNVSENGTRDE